VSDFSKENEILGSLKNIEKKLDILIKIQKSIAPEPKLGSDEKKILKFCNSKYTINEIVEKTQKTKHYIEVILSKLRGSGIIKSVKIKGRIVYSKV